MLSPQGQLVMSLLKTGPLDYIRAVEQGIKRLSARICECRAAGEKIGQTDVLGRHHSGKRIRYANYFLEKKAPRSQYEETLTLCYCPKCELRYERYLFWTGNGTPRFYCKRCLAQVSGQNSFKSHGRR